METIIPKKYNGESVVIIATGPSITQEQIDLVAQSDCRIITVNNSYQLIEPDIQIACNDNWWDYYYRNDERLRKLKADKWTRYKKQAINYNINYIDSIVKDGLSTDPSVVHINHGSGPMAINFATLYGFKKIILIGHDMKFAKDYNGAKRQPGSSPRHYFGEYPKQMQHFPRSKQSVDSNGVIVGLITAYSKMIPDLDKLNIDIVNCTPGTELKCFRMNDLSKEL